MQKISKLSNNTQGILYAVMTCLLVSIIVSIVRHLSLSFHVVFIVMMRNVFSLVFFLPQIYRHHATIFKTQKFHLHFLRNLNGLIAMMIWFYTVTLLPLSEAVSITFIVPIITTFAAMIFLKEKVSKTTWMAIIIGFIGVLIIIRPGFREFKFAYILAILSTCMWAFTNILVKKMTKTETPKTIVAYMCVIMCILSVPPSLPYIQSVTWHDIIWMAILGILSNLSNLSMSVAYLKSDLSILQPFDFTRLIFTAIIAYFAFGEVIDFWVVIGSLVILFGTIIVSDKKLKYERKLFRSL